MDLDSAHTSHDYEHEIISSNSSDKINSGADKTSNSKVNSDPGYSPEVLTGSQISSASPRQCDTEQPSISNSVVQVDVCDNCTHCVPCIHKII